MLEKFQDACIFETQKSRQKSWNFPATSSKLERKSWGNSAPNGGWFCAPLGGSSPLSKWVITCYNPSYKWINPTYPIYNWGYNPLTKWDEPLSIISLAEASQEPSEFSSKILKASISSAEKSRSWHATLRSWAAFVGIFHGDTMGYT